MPAQAGFYRFEAKIISRGAGRSMLASAAYRSGGKSATSAAAYRAGVQLVDERTGESYDYTKKRGVMGAEIMLPAGAPAWMADRGRLWNAVEASEKRKDAQTAKDYVISLPHQLSAEQRYALTKWFVAEQFVSKGYVADIAWHSPDKRQGLNHHAHVMVSMRKVEGDGFARLKDRAPPGMHPGKAWKEDLLRLRAAWAEFANRSLEAAGLDIRVTHESLQTRGIDREAEPKLGPVAMKIAEAGRESRAGNDNRDVKARNAERAQLVAEHAQAVEDEGRIINLMAQRARRGIMDEDAAEKAAREFPEQMREAVDKVRAAEADARATILREAELTAQRIEAAKTRAQRAEEQAKRDHDQHVEAERIRARDGKISSAEARYAIALGETAGTDPLSNLVRAAGAESAAFLRNQEALRAQLADPKLTADQKQEIQLRKDIEFYEYNAQANTRIGGLYQVIGGNEHLVQGGYRDLLAKEQTEQAQKLRKERGIFLDALQQRDRDDMANKLQGLARDIARGSLPPASPAGVLKEIKPEPRAAAAKPQQGPAAEPTDAEAGLSEAQRAKLAQLRATRAGYAKRTEGEPSQERQPTGLQPAQPGVLVGDSAETRDDRQAADQVRSKVTGRTEGDAELSDAQRAKLDRLQATRTGYAEQAAKKNAKDRGGGGRSGR